MKKYGSNEQMATMMMDKTSYWNMKVRGHVGGIEKTRFVNVGKEEPQERVKEKA